MYTFTVNPTILERKEKKTQLEGGRLKKLYCMSSMDHTDSAHFSKRWIGMVLENKILGRTVLNWILMENVKKKD